MPSIRFMGGSRMGGAGGFTAGMYRPQAQTGTPIAEEAGRKPPPPVSRRAHEQWAREQTAANIAAKSEALAPRRWSPKPAVSESTDRSSINVPNQENQPS